ncbi:MAG: NADH-quinone oxidoreductase subunit J [Chitinophagales bacterium]|nr:NADH-quinone oxidoreductase subunit J [Chitinophagales bacterium]MDW8419637.1 NADH-quinone oxidoreductase subunit J [Chitinophagales bacterium]
MHNFTLLLFLILSSLAIFCGLMTVFSRNPIHSALFLIGCFFAIAGHYLLLSAQFLAIVHIIVYAGAIMVLFLFTLMLMNLNEETEQHKPALAKIGAVISAGMLMLVLVAVFKRAVLAPPPPYQDFSIGTIETLGKVLLNEFLLPFEFASVLLLTAMIGAVLLAKKQNPNTNQA